ncbi:MAG: hypothetical protein AB8G26_02750 [Ilumatobacter sp.]
MALPAVSRPSAFRTRFTAGVCTLGLVAGACGGSDDTAGIAVSDDGDASSLDDESSTDGDEGADASSDPNPDGGDPASSSGDGAEIEGPQRSPGDIVEFDVTALSTAPLDVSVLNVVERQGAAPAVTPIVDTCAALPADAMSAIATDIDARFGFGEELTFTATSRGAACDYRSDTHLLTLTIGPSDEVSRDPLAAGAFLPPGAGDVMTTPWPGDASIDVLSENSFDLDTPYGALTTTGEFGLRVDNTGGTGIDFSPTGELFAEMVAAAAAGVGSAPPPVSGDDASGASAGDPCSLFTADELEAFLLGTPFGEPMQSFGPNSCAWDGWGSGGASLSVELFAGDTAYGASSLEAYGSTGAVFQFIGGGLPVIVSPDGMAQVTLRIDMLDGSIPDDAVLALAENLAVRFG